MLKYILCSIVLTFSLLLADSNTTSTLEDSQKIELSRQKITAIDEVIKSNLWFKRYSNYLSYQKISEELSTVEAEIRKFKSVKDKSTLEKYEKLISKQESLQKQLELLQEFKTSPLIKMVDFVELESYPKITNP